MEGRVFRCTWTQVGLRFRVWVRQRPKLAGEGATFAEADEALWGTILEELGDGESEREYDPPRPSDSRLLEILSDRLVLAFAPLYGPPYWPRDIESLFTEESCSRCGNPQGTRTDVPLPLSWVSSDHDVGSVGIRGARQAWKFTFVSDRFLAQLTPAERGRLRWQAVSTPPRTRKRWFEIVGSRVHVPRVALRGAKLRDPWTCTACGLSPISGSSSPGKGAYQLDQPWAFVAASDMPRRVPSVFSIGTQNGFHLAFTPRRWKMLTASRSVRGLIGTNLGVLPPHAVMRRPAPSGSRKPASR
jgi:hypothetical protein